MSDEKSKSWISLPPCPKERFSNMIMIEHNEMVIAPYNYSTQKADSLLKFNTEQLKWSKSIKYKSKSYEISNSTLSFDDKNGELFMCGHQGELTKFNIEKGKHNDKFSVKCELGVNATSLFVDNSLHIIGGSQNRKHLTLNDKQNGLDCVYEFSDGWTKGNQNCGIVNVASKQMILLLGGFHHYNDENHKYSDLIWSFNIKERKWSKMSVKLPEKMIYFGCIITSDERYLVILGGYGINKKPLKRIHVLDLDSMKWLKHDNNSQSNRTCPCSGSVRACMTWDNDIHLIKHDKSGLHWKMNIKCIIDEYNDSSAHYAIHQNIIKKYKKLLENEEIETRKLRNQLSKISKQSGGKSKGSGDGDGDGGASDGGMSKKYKKLLAEKEQECQKLQTENRKMKSHNDKLKQVIDNVNDELDGAKGKMSKKNEKIKALEQRVKELMVEHKELEMIKKLIAEKEDEDDSD